MPYKKPRQFDISGERKTELLVVLAERHGHVIQILSAEEIKRDETLYGLYLYELYLLGNVEGKLLSDNLDAKAMELLTDWEVQVRNQGGL